jgi:hypothetical protein
VEENLSNQNCRSRNCGTIPQSPRRTLERMGPQSPRTRRTARGRGPSDRTTITPAVEQPPPATSEAPTPT